MHDELKSALKSFYKDKRKEAYIEAFKEKQGKIPTQKQLDSFTATILDVDLERDVVEAINKIEELFSPSLLKVMGIFMLPTGFSFAFLATSIGLFLVQINHLNLHQIPPEAFEYFLNYPMLITSIVSLLASFILVVLSMSKIRSS
jgi:hypothetical protein